MDKSKVDLAKLFDKFKQTASEHEKDAATTKLFHGLLDANKIAKTEREDRYAEAFGLLSMKVKEFLLTTTDLTMEYIDKRLSIL